MQERESNILSIFTAFALGGLIGAGIALLMAPQSGRKTRHLILSKSQEIRDRAMESAEDTRDMAGKALDNLTQSTRDQANRLAKRGRKLAKERGDGLRGRVQSVVCE
ncbi:MAG: YtxH domain-containing protein [Omnitrophica WOR_2 bacterium]